jgi:hypothetical protein
MPQGANRGSIARAKGAIRSLNVQIVHPDRPSDGPEAISAVYITNIARGPRGATFAPQMGGFSIGIPHAVMETAGTGEERVGEGENLESLPELGPKSTRTNSPEGLKMYPNNLRQMKDGAVEWRHQGQEVPRVPRALSS